MSMLLCMPWCRIDRPYAVDNIEIVPFERDRRIDGLGDLHQGLVNAIMASYKTIEGRPVDRAALIRHGDHAIIDDLTDEELNDVFDVAALECFSGLAGREFFNPVGPYCNSDCFNLYAQEFPSADSIALVRRRRESQTMSVWPIDSISITVPVHCQTVTKVTLDEEMLRGLLAYPAQCAPAEWVRWQNAISYFNQANTDSNSIRPQVESVLMVGAFQEVLNVGHEAKEVARRFSEVLAPKTSLPTSQSQRASKRWPSSQEPLRYDWMREFHFIRNDFAHGKLSPVKAPVWTPTEHLVLAAMAFPLLVKCLLKERGVYSLSDTDHREMDCFEKLADISDFLERPPDYESSLDTYSSRLQRDWIAHRYDLDRRIADFSAEESRRAKAGDPYQARSDAMDEE